MNQVEQKLYKKLESIYNSEPNIEKSFTPSEARIIDRWMSSGILNKDAFHDSTAMNDSHRIFIQGIGYPFTPLGESEYKKNWYLQFRNSNFVIVIRDLFTIFAFFASLYLAILKILEN